jgi:drug/metabolite transporter (DMT)-like permease
MLRAGFLPHTVDSTNPPPPHARRYRADLGLAALFMLAAGFSFALMSAAVKVAAAESPNTMVVFFRNAVALVVLLPWVWTQGRAAFRTTQIGGHLVRGLAGVTAMSMFFFAIARMPLPGAMLLNQSFPLFLPLGERLWLRDRSGSRAWPSLLLGFAGLVVILRPGAAMFTPVAAVGLLSAVFGAIAQVGIRRLTRTEPITRIVFYFALIGTAASALPLPWVWRSPSPMGWAALVAVGLLATLGQFSLTRSYAHAPAALVGPFVYTGVLFAALLDWLLWQRLPDLFFVPGALLIVAGGAFMLRRQPVGAPRVDGVGGVVG